MSEEGSAHHGPNARHGSLLERLRRHCLDSFEAARQRTAAGLYDSSRLDPQEFERRLFEWAYPSIASSRKSGSRLPRPFRERRNHPRLVSRITTTVCPELYS